MTLQKMPTGYFVPGRNGKPGRTLPKLADAQAYDRELDGCGCFAEESSDALDAADYLADVVEAYLQALNDGVLHAEMELRHAITEYRTARAR